MVAEIRASGRPGRGSGRGSGRRSGRSEGSFAARFAAQEGALTRRQALAAGLSDDVLTEQVRAGRWQRPFPAVYVAYSGPLSRATLRWAAVLRCGAGAMLSHETAAELVGLIGESTGPIHVTVPGRRYLDPVPGIIVHRSERAEQALHPCRTPPQTRVEETIVDLTQRASSLEQAIGWLARGCGQRQTTAPRLRAALDCRKRVRWRTELTTALSDISDGCHSVLELRYLRRVERAHGLPVGHRQARAEVAGRRRYDDVRYDQWQVIVELDGRAAHPDAERWRDRQRDNASVAHGAFVLRYGWGEISERPCAVAMQVATVLRGRGWTGQLRPCGPHCPAP